MGIGGNCKIPWIAVWVFVALIAISCGTSPKSQKVEPKAFFPSSTLVFQFFGGSSTCSNCSQGGTYDNSTYACDNGDGNFVNSFTFDDPLPSPQNNYVVMQVSVTIRGRFNCDNDPTPSPIEFYLQNREIAILNPPAEPSGCSCPHCVTALSGHSSQENNGWPNYNYGSVNEISFAKVSNKSSGICLSGLEITIFYASLDPAMNSGGAFPDGGPMTGGTSLTIFGNNFQSYWSYECQFGNTSAPGTVGGLGLLCMTPSYYEQGQISVSVVVLPFQVAFVIPQYQFFYYPEPQLHFVSPNRTLCNNTDTVHVFGGPFFNLQTIGCKWGDQLFFGRFVNSSCIACQTVTFIGEISLTVAENNQQPAPDSLKVLCIDPNPVTTGSSSTTTGGVQPPPNSLDIPGWVWVVAVFAVVTIVALIVVFGCARRCNQPQPDPEDLRASQKPLLSPTGDSGFTKQMEVNDVKIAQKIGKGTFGEVYRGTWNGTDVAVKFLTPVETNEQFLNDFLKEVNIMRSLRHPNVLQFLGACTEPPNVCIVMEFMPRGSLHKILHDESVKITLSLIKRMLTDAARGMNYLHKSDPMIIHRDLKSHNLLVDESWKVKVCDFGLSKILEHHSDIKSMTACGTPSWTAPEILRNENYTEKADVYSFGIVLWECVTREEPYLGMPPFQVVLSVGTKHLRPVIPASSPEDWANMIGDCWMEIATDRPSFDQVIERLEKMSSSNQAILKS